MFLTFPPTGSRGGSLVPPVGRTPVLIIHHIHTRIFHADDNICFYMNKQNLFEHFNPSCITMYQIKKAASEYQSLIIVTVWSSSWWAQGPQLSTQVFFFFSFSLCRTQGFVWHTVNTHTHSHAYASSIPSPVLGTVLQYFHFRLLYSSSAPLGKYCSISLLRLFLCYCHILPDKSKVLLTCCVHVHLYIVMKHLTLYLVRKQSLIYTSSSYGAP